MVETNIPNEMSRDLLKGKCIETESEREKRKQWKDSWLPGAGSGNED